MTVSKPDQKADTSINEMLPDNLIGADEKVILAVKPSLWLIAFFSFRTVVIAAVVAVILTLSSPRLNLGRWAGYAIQFCALAAIARLAFALLQWASRTYVLTDKRIIRIRGVFTIDIFQCYLKGMFFFIPYCDDSTIFTEWIKAQVVAIVNVHFLESAFFLLSGGIVVIVHYMTGIAEAE